MTNLIDVSLKFNCFDNIQVGKKTNIFGKMFEDKKKLYSSESRNYFRLATYNV